MSSSAWSLVKGSYYYNPVLKKWIYDPFMVAQSPEVREKFFYYYSLGTTAKSASLVVPRRVTYY